MFNIGGGELIVIMIIALIVLGPDKLPEAVRRAGRLYGELRRMSTGFQTELRDALDEPMREVRSTTDLVKGTFTSAMTDEDDDSPAATPPAPPAGKFARLPVPSGGPVSTDLPIPGDDATWPAPAPATMADPELAPPAQGR